MSPAARDLFAPVVVCVFVGGCGAVGNAPAVGPPARSRQPTRWVAYESRECGVRVDFPGIPFVATTEIPTGDGSRAMETGMLELPGGQRAMVVTCTDIGIAAGTEGLMDAAEKGMLARTGATLIAEQPSVGGRELRLSVRDAEIWARLVTVGGSRLMTLVVAPIGVVSHDDARRFLDSPRVAPRAPGPL